MLMMMGSNKVCRAKSSTFGKPKTPRLGISGIDYVNGLANHGYNHFHMNGGIGSGGGSGSSKNDDNSGQPPPQLSKSIEVVQHPHHPQQQLLHHHLDAINKKANSIDSRTSGCSGGGATIGSKLKRKTLQPFEPTYYFDSDFDSEDGGSGRRRSNTLNCSPSFVSRFLRLSRKKSSTSSKRQSKQRNDDQQPLTAHESLRDEQPQQKICDAQQQLQSKRLSEDQQHQYSSGGCGGGNAFRGGLPSNNNNRIYPQDDITTATTTAISTTSEGQCQRHHYHLVQSDVDGENTMIVTTTTSTTATTLPATYNTLSQSVTSDEVTVSANNGTGLLSPLRERLAAIEELTTSLQSWQTTEKTEYEKCVSDLANQVSRAVALQQMMKSEVEKLQQRVVDLENHNKAMATMIIPTLMKLHDTVGIKEGPPLKSIEAAPHPEEMAETITTSADSDMHQSDSSRTFKRSSEMHQLRSPSLVSDNNDHPSHINNTSTTSSPSHFIAVVSTSSSPSSASSSYYTSQNASSQMKTIFYEQASTLPTPATESTSATTGVGFPSNRENITRAASSDLQPLSSCSHSNAMTSSTPVRSPVKAPRTSRAAAAASQIPNMSGNAVAGSSSSSSSLSRSNSRSKQSPVCPAPVISLIENEPSLSSASSSPKRDEHQNQSQIANQNNLLITSLESSITSSTSSSSALPLNSEMSNKQSQVSSSSCNSVPRSSCRARSNGSNNNQSNNHSSTTTRTSLSGIPRMSSPARTATVTKIPCGQQQSASSSNNNCPTPKPARRVSDRSSSPHGSKLPVRKASFISSSTCPASNTSATSPASTTAAATGSNSRHPAASSKSLPANSNMGTAFQNMSTSGPQGSKHSKSTFGFGSRKSSNNNNCNSPRQSSAGGSKSGKKTDSPSSMVANLPESGNCDNIVTATMASSTTSVTGIARPIKHSVVSSGAVLVPTAIGITKTSGTGKDEGYSTMSSEALAEQEHHLRHNNSLEKSATQRGGVGLSRNSTFSVKSNRSPRNTSTIPSSFIGNKTDSSSSPVTTVSTIESSAVGEPIVKNRSSIHKSNTFNTFREIGSRALPSTCNVDDDDGDNSYEIGAGSSRRRIHSSKSNYSPAGNKHRMPNDIMVNSDQTWATRNSSQISSSSGQFTSLPTSSSSTSSSPAKGKLGGESESSTCSGVTPVSKRPAKSSYRKDRITATTRMMDGNIVRIVRGSPYSVRLYGNDSGDDMEDEEDPSSSTILWEDSDDSDILFLPLEVSASSAASSRSTLVPPPKSSAESRSYYSSWGTGSSSMGTSNTYCSTLEKESSNTSVNNSTIGRDGGEGGGANSNSNTFSKRAYPLRRTKGEVTVDVLINNGGGGSFCGNRQRDNDVGEFSNKTSCNSSNGFANVVVTGGGGINDADDLGHLQLVNNHAILNNPPHTNNHEHDNHTTDEMEERALIEKWMQLEEVRNEQVQGGEQWAWDWDGVERTYTRVLRNAGSALKRVPLDFQQDDADDDDLDVDLILKSTLPPPSSLDVDELVNSLEERNNAMNESVTRHQQERSPCQGQQFDSSTWTKSKSRPGSNKSSSQGSGKEAKKKDETAIARNGNNSQDAVSPEKLCCREGGAVSEHQILLVLEGERDIENEAGLLIKRERDGNEQGHCDDVIGCGGEDEDGDDVLEKSHSMIINLDKNGAGVDVDAGGDADCEEDDPPPVIEFTPEFYQLANYGSNLSFSDNESGNVASLNHSSAVAATQSPKVTSSSAGGKNSKSATADYNPPNSPKKRKFTKKSHNSDGASSAKHCSTAVVASTQPKTPTDDKISQTDFSCSSLENMSSVSSSELTAECRNCLEIIKKLVGQADTDETAEEGCCTTSAAESEENGAVFDDQCGRGHQRKKVEKVVDSGSYATTWISVPKGLPTAEVDRILEILSSSESEGVLSPSK